MEDVWIKIKHCKNHKWIDLMEVQTAIIINKSSRKVISATRLDFLRDDLFIKIVICSLLIQQESKIYIFNKAIYYYYNCFVCDL